VSANSSALGGLPDPNPCLTAIIRVFPSDTSFKLRAGDLERVDRVDTVGLQHHVHLLKS
jgi:hypothetical protein